MKALHMVAFTLLAVGGLNWLALALTGWDISQLFGGPETTIAKAIYILVGLSAISELATHKQNCRRCTMPA